MTVRAVSFDFWNTLMRPSGVRGELRIAAARERLARAGHDVADDEIRSAYAAVWQVHHQGWLDNDPTVSGRRFADLVVTTIGRDIDPIVHNELTDIFVSEGTGEEFIPAPGVAAALEGLCALGASVGIICDVGVTPSTGLRRMLDAHGLLELFDGWSFSDEVGYYKPAPEIFHHALAYLGATAGETAHVGDLLRTDVAGARAMGMISVRYRGIADDVGDPDAPDQPDAHVVIDHHDQLLASIGLT